MRYVYNNIMKQDVGSFSPLDNNNNNNINYRNKKKC